MEGALHGAETALNTVGCESIGVRFLRLPLLVYVANWLKAAGCDPVSGGSDSRRTPCGRSQEVRRRIVAPLFMGSNPIGHPSWRVSTVWTVNRPESGLHLTVWGSTPLLSAVLGSSSAAERGALDPDVVGSIPTSPAERML